MSEHVNVLEIDLPEIQARNPYAPPRSHLVKEPPDTWKEADGRRESRTLLVTRIREQVDAWREGDYPGASDTTRRLFQYWFEEDHLLPSGEPFRFYFCQREAVETLVYLYEVEQRRDVAELVQAYFESPDLLELEILTSTKGTRSFRRYIPEIGKQAEQELPPAGLTRYAVKMATGSGKTVVMGLVIAWSLLHHRLEAGSAAADNFLVVAPNVIVYERLREDFESARVFHQLPMVPPEWKNQFALQVTLRGDAREPAPTGNLFLANIQQIYEDNGALQAPINPVAALLGNAPKGNLTTATPMLERVKRLPNLMVLNDEAHHVHDEDLAWNKTLMALHDNLRARGAGGLALWLDFRLRPRTRTVPSSPGSWWTTRWPRPWKTASSRPRSSSTRPTSRTPTATPTARRATPTANGSPSP